MVGLLMWKNGETARRGVTLQECRVLQARMLRADILRREGTPEILLRRRLLAALGKLRRQGITRIVLPEGESLPAAAEKKGIYPVSTLPLRQELAADWVRAALERKGLPISGTRVAVSADRLTGETVRTVTELVLRHRYVLLDLPRGGEDLCRRLRREFGASVMLNPPEEQLRAAAAQILFAPRKGRCGTVILHLYEENGPMPRLLLPPAIEKQLPEGADRGQLLAALREAGALKPGQITVAL